MSAVVSETCSQIAKAMLLDPLPGQADGMWQSAIAGVPYSDTPPDPIALIPRAARGDAEAQFELARMGLYEALAAFQEGPARLLCEGLMFARMAASHGDDEAVMLLITMLSFGATILPEPDARECAAEVVAWLELLADRKGEIGENASRLMVQCAECEPAQTLELAKIYRARMTAATGER